ncbi:type II toxin-antitoxin system HicA family toxin [Sodalis sp. RH14]|uniref:type II toxin-antitoxin system HicA family toxin n=1 Tax=Sodalis sp. RH14 TaxID=3394329 RepID=UPI0039B49090
MLDLTDRPTRNGHPEAVLLKVVIIPTIILTHIFSVGTIPIEGQNGVRMESAKLIKLLINDGWIARKQKASSHITLEKEGVREIIPLPHPRKEISKGVLRQVKKISGLKVI